MRVVNMTPHPVNILNDRDEEIKTIPASGDLIRLRANVVRSGEINGIPLSRTVFGAAQGLPERADGVYYIVSQLVKSALPDRDDLLVPAEVVRNSDGHIIGCRSLGR